MAGAIAKPTLSAEILAVPIKATEIPVGWRVINLVRISPLDLIVLVDRIHAAIPGSAVPPLEGGVSAALANGMQDGSVYWFVTPSANDSETLVSELAFPNMNEPADEQGIAIPGTPDGWVLPTGTAVENIGAVMIEAVPDTAAPLSGDPGQAASLLEFGVKHLGDAERALTAASGSAAVGSSSSGPSAAAIIAAFKKAGLPVTEVVIYSAATDGNHLLGRPGEYVGLVSWGDKRDPGDGNDAGRIEFFASEPDLVARERFLRSVEVLEAGLPPPYIHMYADGHALLRISTKLTSAQAEQYQDVLKRLEMGP